MCENDLVLYVGGFELPDKNAAAHRVLNNAKILKNLGFSVVFSGIDKTITKTSDDCVEVAGFKSYPRVYPINIKKWFLDYFSFNYLRRLIERINPKIVIGYNLHATQLRFILKYCKRKKIVTIGDITEWYDYNFSLHPVKLIKWLDTIVVMRILNKKYDSLITISSFLKNYYSHSIKDIIVIPPLIDIDDKLWKQDTLKNSEKVVFVYSGNPGKTKDDLISIINYVNNLSFDFVFYIIGINYDDFVSNYPKCNNIIEKRLNNYVFKGRLSHTDSIKYLLSSDCCFVFRNNNRKNNAGFPTKFVESVTSGALTIANNYSDLLCYNNLENVLIVDDASLVDINLLLSNNKTRKLNNHFDYRNYIKDFKLFLTHINKNNKKCNNN